MPALMIRAAVGVLLLLSLLSACDAKSSAPASAATHLPVPGTAGPALPHRPLGIGEQRNPQPYTIEQRLLDAASRGDRKTIETALARGANLGAKDDIGRSVVLRAVLDAGDLDLVRWLHAKGAALDEPDGGGRSALSFAAANGRLDIVRYLVENGALVASADVQRRTPLFQATLGDHLDVVSFLLDRGANPNARDQFGDTPLIVACAKGYGDVAALLRQRGADPALKDQEGRTAQERAAPGTDACRLPPPTP